MWTRLGTLLIVVLLLLAPVSVRAITPAGAATIPPVLYYLCMEPACAGKDWHTTNPSWGPVGVMYSWHLWKDLNPADNVYNFGSITTYLDQEQALQVQLADGTHIAKPVVLNVFLYLSGTSNPWYKETANKVDFYDATPNWVYDKVEVAESVVLPTVESPARHAGMLLTARNGSGWRAVMPRYGSPTWRAELHEFVTALGAAFENDGRVAGIVIDTGIDGEMQATKKWNDDWPSFYEVLQYGGVSGTNNGFNILQPAMMDWYRAAFPTKPLLINNAPLQANKAAADYALTKSPKIGIKCSGIGSDQEAAYRRGGSEATWNHTGMYDPMNDHNQDTYNFPEPKGEVYPDAMYWTMLTGLFYHADAMDLYPVWWSYLPGPVMQWTAAHLGKTVGNAPSAFVVLRDFEYGRVYAGSDVYQEGVAGDFGFYMTRLSFADGQALRVQRANLPAVSGRTDIYARQLRKTNQSSGQNYMYFAVASGFADTGPYTVTVKYLNIGADTWSLQYKNGSGALVTRTFAKTGLGEWVSTSVVLDDLVLGKGLGYGVNGDNGTGADLRIACNGDGDEWIHMLEVAGSGGSSPAPEGTPVPVPTSGGTAVATHTPWVLPTRTKTPMPTALPSPTPAPAIEHTFLVSDSTYISAWFPTANYATSQTLIVRQGDVYATLLDFNLTGIAPGTTITNATLYVKATEHSNLGTMELQVYKLNRWWTAQTTWRKATASTLWGTPGANASPSDRAASYTARTYLFPWTSWVGFDVTSLVQGWVNIPSSNAGVILKGRGFISVQYQFGVNGGQAPFLNARY